MLRERAHSMFDVLVDWARRTTTSFSELRSDFGGLRPAEAAPAADLIYRLRHWPDLPPALRTAQVLRLLSVMSNRPVRHSWILRSTRLDAARLDRLLDCLKAQEALEVIDASTLPTQHPVR